MIPEADLNRTAPLSTTYSLLTLRIPGKRGLEAGIQLPEAGQCGPCLPQGLAAGSQAGQGWGKGLRKSAVSFAGVGCTQSETANICEERHEWRLELALCPARSQGSMLEESSPKGGLGRFQRPFGPIPTPITPTLPHRRPASSRSERTCFPRKPGGGGFW